MFRVSKLFIQLKTEILIFKEVKFALIENVNFTLRTMKRN